MAHSALITLRSINELSDAEADLMTAILNKDGVLRHWLGMENAPEITREDFRQTAEEWQKEKRAQTYIIYAQEAIGSISISHISEDGTARIGYWLASKAWNQGIGTEAFALALEKARQLGIHKVRSEIQADNIASLRMWQRWGAEQEMLSENCVRVMLDI